MAHPRRRARRPQGHRGASPSRSPTAAPSPASRCSRAGRRDEDGVDVAAAVPGRRRPPPGRRDDVDRPAAARRDRSSARSGSWPRSRASRPRRSWWAGASRPRPWADPVGVAPDRPCHAVRPGLPRPEGRPLSRANVALAALLTTSVLVAGCGGDDDDPTTRDPEHDAPRGVRAGHARRASRSPASTGAEPDGGARRQDLRRRDRTAPSSSRARATVPRRATSSSSTSSSSTAAPATSYASSYAEGRRRPPSRSTTSRSAACATALTGAKAGSRIVVVDVRRGRLRPPGRRPRQRPRGRTTPSCSSPTSTRCARCSTRAEGTRGHPGRRAAQRARSATTAADHHRARTASRRPRSWCSRSSRGPARSSRPARRSPSTTRA